MKGLAEVQRQFVTNSEFTAGFATHYAPDLLTGDDTHLGLATGFPPGGGSIRLRWSGSAMPGRPISGMSIAPMAAGVSTSSPTWSTREVRDRALTN